jgi:uncharacterized MnhB-related membrane protein
VISPETLVFGVLAALGLISMVATFMAVLERDLLKAVLFSAVQSTAYAFMFYILMAPDILLVYVPVAVGLYPAVILLLIKKTERFEGGEEE